MSLTDPAYQTFAVQSDGYSLRGGEESEEGEERAAHNKNMLKGLLARLISTIKGIKIPPWILFGLLAILMLENVSKMLNAFVERVRGVIESWRNPGERIEMPHTLLGLVIVALAAVLLYLAMFKLILVIVTIFASAFYLRYRIMMEGIEQRGAKKRRRLAKAQRTDKSEKRRLLRSQLGSVDEGPVIRKEFYERGSAPSLHGDTTDAATSPADLHSQFKGANAKLRRRLKDKLEEWKDKLRQRKPLKTVL